MAYLLELVGRLSEGCGRQTEQQRENWAQAVKGFQTNDGGFRGRSDESDIYYTAFAVRTLAIIDGLLVCVAQAAQAALLAESGFLDKGRTSSNPTHFSVVSGIVSLGP